MTYSEIKELCRKGKVGLIPGLQGYLKYNYGNNQLEFLSNNYILAGKLLEDKIINRTDLYYII